MKRVYRRQWTSEEDAWLGQISDKEIAARLGVSPYTVRRRRDTLGLSIYQGQGRPISNWTAKTEALLGTMSDGQLAAQLGMSRESVKNRRRSLAIAPFRKARISHGKHIPIDAARVKARREAFGFTRFALSGHNTALATHLGLIENGRQKAVTPESLERLCALLGCRAEEIVLEG